MEKNRITKQNSVNLGDVYGELTVIEEDFEREQVDIDKRPKGRHFRYYKCRCSCGKETTVQVYQLVDGRTRSCGHLQRLSVRNTQIKDMTGQKIGGLTALMIDYSKEFGDGKHTYWICRCDKCGQEASIRSSEFRQGLDDCGCEKYKRLSNGKMKDLNGKIFGHLHIIGRDWSTQQSGKHARWICKCDLCGRTEINSSSMLTVYGKDRCKICCGVSAGENKIYELLTANNIKFEHDKSYKDLKYPDTGGVPRFDFRITQKSDCDYIIEFDGEQHFKKVPMFDSIETFNKRLSRDKFKNDWCKQNNIPMIRIPFDRLKGLCIDDLLLDTTKYLVA